MKNMLETNQKKKNLSKEMLGLSTEMEDVKKNEMEILEVKIQ